MTSKTILVIISTWQDSVSFSTVCQSMLKDVSEEMECYVLAVDLDTDTKVSTGNFFVIPCNVSSYITDNASHIFKVISELKPTIILYYFDLFVAHAYAKPLLGLKQFGVKLVAYLPIDGLLHDLHPISSFLGFDQVVFFQKIQIEQLTKIAAIKELLTQVNTQVSFIPHPIDSKFFFEIEDMEVERKNGRYKLLSRSFKRQDAFIFMNGNRPIPRKRLDITVEAFSIFLKETGANSYLLLHKVGKCEESKNILAKINNLNIRNKVIVRKDLNTNKFLSKSDLNDLYNISDVGINTAMGEGWGLVSFEHALAKKAQITSGITILKEIWSDNALHGEIIGKKVEWDMPGTIMEVASSESIAIHMYNLYRNKNLSNEMAERAFNHANSDDLKPETISNQWRELILALIN